MQTSPAFQPAPPASSRAVAKARRLVIDAPTRMFHWLFAASFAGAYLTGDSERWRDVHVALGYAFAGLLVFRVLYGLWGPSHASLGPLWRQVSGAPGWLRWVARGLRSGSLRAVPWRQGQNLLMALAMGSLLLLALPLALSGYGAFHEWGAALGGGEWLEELHGFFGEAVLAVVGVHLGLIAATSLLRRKNQAQAMLTGRIDGSGPDRVRRNPVWLAALLLAAVLAFLAWEWQQAPAGGRPGEAVAQGATAALLRDDDEGLSTLSVGSHR